jgi:hypothetical protein
LQANNLKQVTPYIKAKRKSLEAHNIFESMKRLELPGNRHHFAEKIDKDVEASSLAAEKAISILVGCTGTGKKKGSGCQQMFVHGKNSSE